MTASADCTALSSVKGTIYIALAVASALLGIALLFVLPALLKVDELNNYQLLLSVALQEILLIGLPAMLLTRRRESTRERINRLLKAPDGYAMGLVSVGAVSFTLAAVFVTALWIALLQGLGIEVPLDAQTLTPKGTGEYLVAVLCAALLPAFCEELMFRGLFLPWLGSKMGERTAILLSALIFSLLHFSLLGFLSLAAIGILLARLLLRYQSLWLPMLFHGVYNAVVLLLNSLSARPSPSMIMLSTGVFIAVGYLLFKKEETKAWN